MSELERRQREIIANMECTVQQCRAEIAQLCRRAAAWKRAAKRRRCTAQAIGREMIEWRRKADSMRLERNEWERRADMRLERIAALHEARELEEEQRRLDCAECRGRLLGEEVSE